MADTVTATTVFDGSRKLVRHLTNLSDGTGESAVVKVDKSAFVGPNGLEPSQFAVEKISYDVSSMRVYLSFDRTSDVPIAVLQGQGCIDFTDIGGLHDTGTGDTGDILLTTAGHASGDGYDITLHLRKKD
jgi:hypothetical protein